MFDQLGYLYVCNTIKLLYEQTTKKDPAGEIAGSLIELNVFL